MTVSKEEVEEKRLVFNDLTRIPQTAARNKILLLLFDAEQKHMTYCDTDSIIFPEISEEEVLNLIRKLPDVKNLILVTGRIGMSKTSLAMRLAEGLNQETPLIFDYEIMRECDFFSFENKDIAVFGSLNMIPVYLFHRVGMLIDVGHLNIKKKEMKAKLYIFGEEKQFVEVMKVFNITIPFCSFTNYKKYAESKYQFFPTKSSNENPKWEQKSPPMDPAD